MTIFGERETTLGLKGSTSNKFVEAVSNNAKEKPKILCHPIDSRVPHRSTVSSN
jgi:hypothetical protein